MDNGDVVYVIGHRNPDMDTIASALGYAWVLSTRDGLNCRAARAGEMNAQTVWALKRFGVEPPEVMSWPGRLRPDWRSDWPNPAGSPPIETFRFSGRTNEFGTSARSCCAVHMMISRQPMKKTIKRQ